MPGYPQEDNIILRNKGGVAVSQIEIGERNTRKENNVCAKRQFVLSAVKLVEVFNSSKRKLF